MTTDRSAAPLSRFLSAFSLGLGIAQLAVPQHVNRLAGIRDDATSRLWQRLAGVVALAVFAARRAGRAPERQTEEEAMHVKAAITVRKPREEVYRFWRDLENLPSFMAHVESVEGNGNGRSHWKVKAPAGTHVEWDAELVEERPGEALVWHAVEGSDVDNSGAVRFLDAPRNQGTEVHVEFDYGAPGGRFGEAVAKLFGEEPTQQAKDDLRRFKQVMETGFVVRSEGSPEGSTARRHLKQRPGQPLPEEGS